MPLKCSYQHLEWLFSMLVSQRWLYKRHWGPLQPPKNRRNQWYLKNINVSIPRRHASIEALWRCLRSQQNKEDSKFVTTRLSDRLSPIPVWPWMSTHSQILEVTLVKIKSQQVVDTVLVMASRLVLNCDRQQQIVSVADASWRLLWINSFYRLL